jgi:hypothetical protein
MNVSGKSIYAYQELAFDAFITLTYILTVIYIFGISSKAKGHLDMINNFIRIYITLFLIYRFNPFRKNIDFTSLDRKIVFSTGLFMFATNFLGFVFF